MQITVDGIKYDVDFNHGIINVDTLAVFDMDENLVGSAEIDHNAESIDIQREDGEEDSYNYHEYTTPEDLAEWIVSTSI